jgi:two-component system heavy metal sensor histidine kinase CusS
MTFNGSRSLTLRLSLLFAGASFLILSASGLFLHQSLAQQFLARDKQDLFGKIELIRHTLADVATSATIRRTPERWLDVVVGHHGLHLALFDANGSLLLANSALRFPHALLGTAVDELEQSGPIREFHDNENRRYRAVIAWGRLEKSAAERVLIAFALDLSDEAKMLADYRTNILIAVLAGTLLAAALGTWVARQGLAPLQHVAIAAGRITASRLNERLDAGSVPAELQALTTAYNDMLERLQDSFMRLSQFSSDLAHDLRTPIGNLLGEAQVALSRTRGADEYRSVIESSVEELERLSRMIESMLFLARADNAQLALHPEVVDLAAEFERIRDYFEPLAQEKGVSIEANGTDSVFADPSLLRRAIGNLVANAIQFTPRAGGTVTLGSARTAEGGTTIRVSNPGLEIPPAERGRIFDRFYRVERAREDSTSSSGLGLAIVKSIAGLHAGSASVESGAGRTTFTLVFPAANAGRLRREDKR